MKKISNYFLELAVFICGGSLMILELVGSRVLAPYVGSSTIVWTSLIGIILGFLSLGYFLGGKIADKKPSEKILSFVIFLSAFFVFLIVIINAPILYFIRDKVDSIYFGSVLATVILFGAPSFLLGMVSPYAVKLRMKDINSSAKTVGNLYAFSTLGSIAGTFATGFLLIPFLGTVKILYCLTILLVISSALLSVKTYFKTKVLIVLFLCFFFNTSFSLSSPAEAKGLVDLDTQYNRLWIYPSKAPNVPRAILRLTTDPFSVQSGMFIDRRDDDLVYKYTKFFRLADHFDKNIKKALMIGGAAYSYPKDFLKTHPDGEITVVEIDPGMTKVAREYFNLKDDSRLKIIHQDGRVFLNKSDEKYDVIFIDAFNSKISIPFHLTTREMVELVYDHLEDDGFVFVNIASSLDGDGSKFLRAEMATYEEVFPEVYLYTIDTQRVKTVQNIMMIAFKSKRQREEFLKSDNDEYQDYLNLIWTKKMQKDLPILIDDYAPVEYYAKDLITWW